MLPEARWKRALPFFAGKLQQIGAITEQFAPMKSQKAPSKCQNGALTELFAACECQIGALTELFAPLTQQFAAMTELFGTSTELFAAMVEQIAAMKVAC